MTRKLKVLGLALMAVLAVSAIGAAGAQAEFTFTAYDNSGTHTHALISSTQTAALGDEFRITTGRTPLKCKKVTGSGTSATGKDTTQTVTPTFDECEAAGADVTVNPTNCDFRFKIGAKVTEHKYTGTTDVVCAQPTERIHVSLYNGAGVAHDAEHLLCEFTIEPQEGITGVTYTNITEGATKYVEVDVEAHNIKAEVTKGNILCDSTGATVTEAVYTGHEKVTAKDTENVPLNVTVSG